MDMIHALSSKPLILAVSCALALGAASGAARAQAKPGSPGYVEDVRDSVVRSTYGLCWRTGTGPAPASTPECDPNYVPPPVAKVPPPAPAVAAPEAAPVVAPLVVPSAPMAAVTPAAPAPPPKPVIERVTLDADALFDFDKADLRPTGRAALDEFVAKIQDVDAPMITAVGHTDRFGSDPYNQRLSEQRVEAVKAYLVSKGVAPDRIRTEGKGETQPVTKPGQCDGPKSPSVIACLQPDRRVEVEVAGTRIVR